MRVVLSEPSPLVSFGGTDYVIRVARVRSLPADGEPDLFAIVAELQAQGIAQPCL